MSLFIPRSPSYQSAISAAVPSIALEFDQLFYAATWLLTYYCEAPFILSNKAYSSHLNVTYKYQPAIDVSLSIATGNESTPHLLSNQNNHLSFHPTPIPPSRYLVHSSSSVVTIGFVCRLQSAFTTTISVIPIHTLMHDCLASLISGSRWNTYYYSCTINKPTCRAELETHI